MRPGTREALPTGETGALNKSVPQPNVNQTNRRGPNQRERVRRMLQRGWMCGIEFLDPPDGLSPILRYSAHFHSLRREGWLIDRQECEHPWHNHRRSTMYQWRIVGHVDEGRLALGGAE